MRHQSRLSLHAATQRAGGTTHAEVGATLPTPLALPWGTGGPRWQMGSVGLWGRRRWSRRREGRGHEERVAQAGRGMWRLWWGAGRRASRGRKASLRGDGCGNGQVCLTRVASRDLGEWREVVAGVQQGCCLVSLSLLRPHGAMHPAWPSGSAPPSSGLQVSLEFRKLQAASALCSRFPSSFKARVIFVN